jgi:glutathione S-transferase
MDFELVSFKICPFVQRSRITLLHKRVPHTVTYIDLKSPPAWFSAASPLGKVPLLRVDGDTVLFESAVINEFIDETTPPPLLPDDPLARALNRAWIAFASELQGRFYQVAMAPDEGRFNSARTQLLEQLGRLEEALGDGPWFNGAAFSLVDASYAPLFMRLALLEQAAPLLPAGAFPRAMAWSAALLALPEVRDSVVEDFPELYRTAIAASAGYGAARFAPEPTLDRVGS